MPPARRRKAIRKSEEWNRLKPVSFFTFSFIEVPSFTKVDIRNLLKNITPKANENVVIPLKTINYLREKMDCFKDLIINEDVVVPNAFCGMMYIQKLNKISEKLITYRDLGPLKYGTMQPERGGH